MRVVTLEEHITVPEIEKRISKEKRMERGWPDPDATASPTNRVADKLSDVEAERLPSMEANGIIMQVLSVTGPGGEELEPVESIRFAHDYNSALAKIVQAHPSRFSAFATLPMTAPEAAADELERAVKLLSFCGAMINGTTNSVFLDDAQFAPILSRAEALDVPIYLHPNLPLQQVINSYFSHLPRSLGFMLSIAGFGWHSETAIHILRLILAGTFDKYPGLKIIIGHMGEMLPMMMDRINKVYKDVGLQRTVREVLQSQVFITTSGLFSQPPLQVAIDTFGVDKILFSIDYPYSPNEAGKSFLDDMKLSDGDKEKIAHQNADQLLKLHP